MRVQEPPRSPPRHVGPQRSPPRGAPPNDAWPEPLDSFDDLPPLHDAPSRVCTFGRPSVDDDIHILSTEAHTLDDQKR